MTCPRCGSPDLIATPTPAGPHHARLDCAAGHFVKWLPRPVVPMDRLTLPPGIPDGEPLPALTGTPGQVAFAEKLRPKMLALTARFVAPEVVRAMRTIAESSWWIGNKDRQWVGEIRWPKEWEV
jgi:hypothetical protein